MLCWTSVLSSVLRSLAQVLGELLYAVLHICALVPSWALGELLYAVLFICAAHLCCHLCSELRP